MMDFHIALPSNASYREFPNNSNSDYRVHLARPLVLPEGQWVVGMTDIIFNKSWINVESGGFLVTYGVYSKIHSDATHFHTTWKRLLIPPGQYASVREVVLAMQRAISVAGLERSINLYYDQIKDKVRVKQTRVADNRAVIRFADQPTTPQVLFDDDLCDILGFARDISITDVEAWSTRKPDVHRGMSSMFVYSDVVQERLVGDSLVPLLRVVPVSGLRNQVVHTEFNVVHYLPVNNLATEIIRVRICRDNGEPISFSGGKVNINLHFKKVQ